MLNYQRVSPSDNVPPWAQESLSKGLEALDLCEAGDGFS
jgi:hypothetical protein